jgi:hypothetical protein
MGEKRGGRWLEKRRKEVKRRGKKKIARDGFLRFCSFWRHSFSKR